MESGLGPLFRLVTVLALISFHVLALTPRGQLWELNLHGVHARTVALRSAQRRALPLPPTS
jgi:hypothetical protein